MTFTVSKLSFISYLFIYLIVGLDACMHLFFCLSVIVVFIINALFVCRLMLTFIYSPYDFN